MIFVGQRKGLRSLGQKQKNSIRALDVRFTPESGHPICAVNGLTSLLGDAQCLRFSRLRCSIN